jgi:hypothetical protein
VCVVSPLGLSTSLSPITQTKLSCNNTTKRISNDAMLFPSKKKLPPKFGLDILFYEFRDSFVYVQSKVSFGYVKDHLYFVSKTATRCAFF